MRRKLTKWLWALTLLVLVLASGCTGTVEDPIETLLIVGFTSEGRGQLALIENRILQDGTLTWLTESVRDLPGLPLAADVVDRARERTALAVLSRDRDNPRVSYLSTFNLRNLAPDRLDGFAETREMIALNNLPGPQPAVICPTRLQVSSDGRFAAVLNQPSACDATGDISISVIELDQDPRFVKHYEGMFALVANALVIDQAGDTLYFLEAVGASVQLKSLTLTDLVVRTVGGPAGLRAADVQDMGIVQNSLVVLGSDRFAVYSDYRSDPAEPAIVTTTATSRRLIGSDFADLERVIILGQDHFTVHQSVTRTAQPPATLRDYQSGTVEALNRLVFVVRSGRVAVFDELSYREDIPALTTIPLPELTATAPAFISWVAAAVPPP